jgi:protocatechuate 3,4-dioxygenase beta subunit
MAIIVRTDNPENLLTAIKKAIKDEKIKTWSCDTDGDFTHETPDQQWAGKAWFRSNSDEKGELRFGLLGQQNAKKEAIKMSRAVYSVYHGRFIEMLLTHFHGHMQYPPYG